MIKQLFLLTLIVLAMTGCSSQAEKLSLWADDHNSKTSTLETPSFPLKVVTPLNLQVNKTLTIFIEGDGRAWATTTQPSLDPSPHVFSTVALAMNAVHPGVYLARPCQFVMNVGCEQSAWTDARFSRAAVDATQSAINTLKKRYGAQSIELIGYSGGAAVALLVAGERDDVKQIQTISGNVDPQAWVKLNKLSALNGSLDPLTNLQKLSRIPQRHFIGLSDKVIPVSLTLDFVDKISARCAEVVEGPGDHASLISTVTGDALSKPIACGRRH